MVFGMKITFRGRQKNVFVAVLVPSNMLKNIMHEKARDEPGLSQMLCLIN